MSKKISFGEKSYKYFTGYLYKNHKVKPLNIILTKITAYGKSYDRRTKWVYFLTEDGGLLEKYNTVQDKVSDYTKKNLIENLSIKKNF